MQIDNIKVWTNKILIGQSDNKKMCDFADAWATIASKFVKFTKNNAAGLLEWTGRQDGAGAEAFFNS